MIFSCNTWVFIYREAIKNNVRIPTKANIAFAILLTLNTTALNIIPWEDINPKLYSLNKFTPTNKITNNKNNTEIVLKFAFATKTFEYFHAHPPK